MPTDIESQLRELGHRFRAEMIHVDAGEVLERSPADGRQEAGTIVHLAEPSATRRGPRWLLAVAAASGLVLVAGLALIAQRDGIGGGVSDRPEVCQRANEAVLSLLL